MKNRVHLICNAHLDPVWLWEWEEGAAAAVSTFRAAADFCEENDHFVFCHNEALLYRWVEEYEPPLFERIQKLVKAGRWHIIGGWYLQPDCNMPSGESFVRQIRLGREYFQEKFGVEPPRVAVNFDPFGHTKGLVQILVQAGYEGYLMMRPAEGIDLPGNDFVWIGCDGSRILTHRLDTNYNSPLGGARAKAEKWLTEHQDLPLGMIPWGVGNHGGGPSRQDIADLDSLITARTDVEMTHSTPEAYFNDLKELESFLGEVNKSLNPWAIGCYTSQIRIKQRHRQLENLLMKTERIASQAAMRGLMVYPAEDLREASRDMCMSQFHDILPGSSIQPVEEAALRQMDHGLELLSRLHARAFFALASTQAKAKAGETPILAYNPHPYPVEGVFACEFMLADQNWKEEFTLPRIFAEDGTELPSQIEKEQSSIPLDWRKNLIFRAVLAPMSLNRFDCRMEILPKKPVPSCPMEDGCYVFRNGEMEVRIGLGTGLIESYAIGGQTFLLGGSAKPLLLSDNSDPWNMLFDRTSTVEDEFSLMSPGESARFSGVKAAELPPVRVIEDGDVRTVIESALRCRDSYIVMNYLLPKKGTELELRVRVQFAEKDKMLKLSLRTPMKDRYLGEVAFGAEELPSDGRECVSQKWNAAVDDRSRLALTVVNDGTYGSDFRDGEIRVSLLRSAAYSAHPIEGREPIPQDRFTPRIDQGERLYAFRIRGGEVSERLGHIGREALAMGEAPYVLSFFPNGDGGGEKAPLVSLSDDVILLTALRASSRGGWMLRLFEPSGTARETFVSVPSAGIHQHVVLGPFQVKTFRLDLDGGALTETDILA